MNYLGHATLSGNDNNILIGNMLGDFIKGKQHTKYPKEIQDGMLYHRLIDEYTDKHPSIRACNKIIREAGVKKYAGVFVDIFFDHFLANDKTHFPTEQSLKEFTESTLQTLGDAQDIMNEDMKKYFGYMISYNWLFHYRSREGIEKAIMGIVKRYPRLGNADEILFALFNNMETLYPHYKVFITDIKAWSKMKLQEIDEDGI